MRERERERERKGGKGGGREGDVANVNVKYVYPREFSRFYNLHPWYWNSLLFGLISSEENSAHFLQLIPFTSFEFFVPPGTNYCWVGNGSME